MRTSSARNRHEAYAVYVLTDENAEVHPVRRAQSLDLNTDFSTETLQELGNEGYVQIKANTPVVGLGLGGNQVAVDLDTNSHALQWLGLLANGYTEGDGRNEVFAIGDRLVTHDGDIHQPVAKDKDDVGLTAADDSPYVLFTYNPAAGGTGISKFAFTFTNERPTTLKDVTFWVSYLAGATNFAGLTVDLYQTSAGVPTTKITDATAYYSSDGTTRTSLGTTVDFAELTADTFATYFQAVFNNVRLARNTTYAIVLEIDTASYDYAAGAGDEVILAADTYHGTGATPFNCYAYTHPGASWGIHTIDSERVRLCYSLNLDDSISNFDVYTAGWVEAAGDIADTLIRIPSTVDALVPVKSPNDTLGRIQVYHQLFTNSMSWAFEVGGVATWEAALEGDNESLLDGTYKTGQLASIEAEVGTNLTASATKNLNSESTEMDTLDLPAAYQADDIYAVYLNGELLEQATTNAQLNAVGVVRWCMADTFSTDQEIGFTENSLVENDVVRVLLQPQDDPSWEDYRLVSEPGDQGGLYKGEMDIRMILDTTLARVIEGLEVADASITTAGDEHVRVSISPGAAYIRMEDAVNDQDLQNPNGNGIRELFRVTETTYFRLDNATEFSVVYATTDPFGNLQFLAEDAASTNAALASIFGGSSSQVLILASVSKAAAGTVTAITDLREFHTNTMSLIQSASYSADLAREVIMELGNKRAVSRSLTKPVPVTTDFVAKDTDEEIYVSIHQSDQVDSIAASANNVYTNQNATFAAGVNLATGAGMVSTTGISVGDIIEVRGSLAIVTSLSDDGGTNNVANVAGGWYGGRPLNCAEALFRNGILKSDKMSERIGIQVNLYDDDARAESDKQAVIETVDARPSSQSLSVSVGGDGELSVSVLSDNLRAFVVA